MSAPPTVLSLIAALEAKTAEAVQWEAACTSQDKALTMQINEAVEWGREREQERDEARAEVERYKRQARRAEAKLTQYERSVPALTQERDDARAALKAKDSYVGDLEEQLKHIRSLWRTTGRVEADAHRRADRAEDAIERVREAATEVANQGDNQGRTHYEGCWKHHLHCLAAKIIYETGADDE